MCLFVDIPQTEYLTSILHSQPHGNLPNLLTFRCLQKPEPVNPVNSLNCSLNLDGENKYSISISCNTSRPDLNFT